MAAKKQRDQIGALIGDVESLAQKLRSDIRKQARAAGMPRDLRSAAKQLRKGAATLAAQVENYVHQLRKKLEAGPAPAHRTKAGRRKHATA